MWKYIVHGKLFYNGKMTCHTVAGIDGNGRYWNIRGGLEYMQRNHEITPCHVYKSLDALNADISGIYNRGGWNFKPIEPYEI
jgi:hypothetical protein